MRKKLKLLVFFVLGWFVLLLCLGATLFYIRQKSTLPLATPVTKTPQILALTRLLARENLVLQQVPSEKNGVISASISGSLVLFKSSKDLNLQVKALQLLTNQLKMESVKPREIDLRFEKVILRY